MAICLERSADLHVAQLMPLPLTVSCSSKIQIGFTFLVPAHLGSPGQRAIKPVCVCINNNYCTLLLGHIACICMSVSCTPVSFAETDEPTEILFVVHGCGIVGLWNCY